MSTTLRMDPLAWTMLIALATIWGLSFPIAEIALTGLPVLTVVALRVALGTVVLWAVVFALRLPVPRSGAAWGALVILGVINNAVPFSLIVWGQTTITAGLAAVLNATTPLFAGLLAGVFLPDERLTPARLGGIMLGVAGVAVIVGPGALGAMGEHVLAQLAVVGAAFAYGCASVFARRFKRLGVTPVVIGAGQTLFAALVLVPVALLVDRPFALPAPGAAVWLAVIAFAVFGTALAYILYFAILARAGATNTALVTVLIPVVAVLAGAAFLGEAVTAPQLAGMALIILALSVIDGRLWRRRAVRPA